MQDHRDMNQGANRYIVHDRPAVSETITISVAEYHFLTKAATLLEVIENDLNYCGSNTVEAVKSALREMRSMAAGEADQ